MTFSIRLARAADSTAVADIYRPAVTERATSFELEPPDATEMRQRIVACLERMPWLVAEDDGNVVGYAYASPHRTRLAYQWSVEVSAYVDERAQQRGVGRGLYEALFRVLVLQGFRNAYAGITLPNAASEGFHRRLGFTRVGVFRDIGFKQNYIRAGLIFSQELAPLSTPNVVFGTHFVGVSFATRLLGRHCALFWLPTAR